MAVIGRERERLQVEAVLGGRGVRAVVLHGEAGIGKTALWTETLEVAGARGYRVVSTRPTEAEAKLPFVGLSDLLGDLVDAATNDLPRPQLVALEAALMRTDVEGEPIQPLALALGALEVIRAASAARPLAIGIDDVGWLDESSAGVLRFALRRLGPAAVVVIATVRSEDAAPTPAIVADLEAARMTFIDVGPLGARDIEALVEKDAGLALSPAAQRRVHRVSEGNPLHALEIARALAVAGTGPDATQTPDSLTSLVRRRLGDLSPEARTVTVHAAALARPTSRVLEQALGRDVVADGVANARGADVLGPGDDPIRFTHPLLAAEAYGALSEADRRAVHARLARVIVDTEERARHLALAADGPDPEVVAELEAAALIARERGARDAAADLSELAAGLAGSRWGTHAPHGGSGARPPHGRRHRTGADAARGSAHRTRRPSWSAPRRAALRPRERSAVDGRPRRGGDTGRPGTPACRNRRGPPRPHQAPPGRSGIRHRAIVDAGRAPRRRGAPACRPIRRRGARSGHPGPDASWRYATGRRVPPDLARRAEAAEPWTRQLRTLDLPAYDLATIDLGEGRTSSAYERLRALADRAEHDGDYSSLPFLLANIAIGDFLDGRGDEARSRIDRALHLARTTDQRTAQVHVLAHSARLEARLGSAEHAAHASEAAFELMSATGWRVGEWFLRTDLAVLELGRGDPAAALAHVRDAADSRRHEGSGRWRVGLGVAVEALVSLGRLEEATSALEADERRPSGRVRADRLRARARLLGALGDQDAADAAITAALDAHRGMDDRWEVARTQVVAGEIHRRARRRALARAALRDALEGFLFLGARSWADVARDQLARAEAGHADGMLTPTQRTVASLAAGGMRNKQIAGRLGMSAHTVEAHLSVVYRTLGIRRRGELPLALGRLSEMRDSGEQDRDSASS